MKAPPRPDLIVFDFLLSKIFSTYISSVVIFFDFPNLCHNKLRWYLQSVLIGFLTLNSHLKSLVNHYNKIGFSISLISWLGSIIVLLPISSDQQASSFFISVSSSLQTARIDSCNWKKIFDYTIVEVCKSGATTV